MMSAANSPGFGCEATGGCLFPKSRRWRDGAVGIFSNVREIVLPCPLSFTFGGRGENMKLKFVAATALMAASTLALAQQYVCTVMSASQCSKK